MARPRTLSDEAIVARARTLFLTQGHRVGTSELAAAIGLTWPALVARFGGKPALFARAIVEPIFRPADLGVTEHATDLRQLLDRLSRALDERWLMRLHCRLATGNAAPDDGLDALPALMTSALARTGKNGVPPRVPTTGEIARLAIAALVGDAVQRFVRCKETAAADSEFLDGLAHLLVSASGRESAADRPGVTLQETSDPNAEAFTRPALPVAASDPAPRVMKEKSAGDAANSNLDLEKR